MTRIRDLDGNYVTLEGEQNLRQLGPFHISHETPGIWGGSPTVGLADLPQGATVFRSWIVLTEAFNTPNNTIALGITIDGDLDNAAIFAIYDAGGTSGNGNGYNGTVPISGPDTDMIGVAVGASDQLCAFVDATDPPTTGEGDVYVLVAVPS